MRLPSVQRHGREAHNMEVSREQVLAMARPAWAPNRCGTAV